MKSCKNLLLHAISIILILFQSGCIQQKGMNDRKSTTANLVECTNPYIKIGKICCMDMNNNKICDKDETATNHQTTTSTTTRPTQTTQSKATTTATLLNSNNTTITVKTPPVSITMPDILTTRCSLAYPSCNTGTCPAGQTCSVKFIGGSPVECYCKTKTTATTTTTTITTISTLKIIIPTTTLKPYF